MRLRSSSIRAKIIALLLVPIVALTGLWAYATLVTTGDVWSQLNVSGTLRAFGEPTDQYVLDLQAERRTAVLYLAAPDAKENRDAYQSAQAVTDRDLAVLRGKAESTDAGRLDFEQRARWQAVVSGAGELAGLRSETARQAGSWDFMLRQYNAVVQPVFSFRSSFVSRQSGQLPRQGLLLTELMRAREYLAQEDAAMEALQRTGDPDNSMVQSVLDALHSQKALFSIYIPELDAQDNVDFVTLRGGDSWSALASVENYFDSAADRHVAAGSIAEENWRAAADRTLGSLADLDTRMANGLGAKAKSYAVQQLLRGGIAGAVGLFAVVLSVIISFRIGRGLVRQLLSLRNAARELAGARLPAVMLRLRRGEPVDVNAESPELDLGPGEIGQVGQAFNQVQRAALQAAVEQAELRRGVSAVFVNLARRSQVLLHRQLTLLDAMERRTEDARELEDLFRLDHLTTRMRRHAEGLIILSGGSPGRAWRKPVRMVDVVRAAVGEVEDYARVIVRPFPGTGLVGSAVADVTHLIAELVENACIFSPPQTQVTVQGEVVAHGFCLEIDDRGLGLSEQALAEINERLAVEQEFDLADTDRLGLFVVSRLARRHGIRVHLRQSPYGGSSAVVLIPRELLADAAGSGGAHARQKLAAVPDLAEDGGHRRSSAEEPVRSVPRPVRGPRPSAPEPGATPAGLPRRRSAAGEGSGRHRRPDSQAGETPGAGVSAPTPAHSAGLPQRVRQASLAPQLKARASEEPSGESVRERSPEEARSTFASFQRGYSRGRGERGQPASLTVVPDPPSPPSAEPVGPAVAAHRPAALPAAPVPQALPAAPPAPPASSEGTETP